MHSQLVIDFFHYQSVEEMPAADRALVEQAEAACKGANAPYSNFRVGAAIRLADGRYLSAANCESEVFPSGMCAERSLLYYYATNYADVPIESLAIASVPSLRECYPCGGCRQTILDVERRQQSPIRIVMSGGGQATVLNSAADLMPFSFKL
ncbi:MAG: cytidine deaminase [Alistipes sp.]|nr:cytidine deaminase [Alistipes sp.]